MKIIARQSERTYLVQVSDTHARVLDLDEMVLRPPLQIQQILGRGYWKEDTRPLEPLMVGVTIKERP